MGGFVLLEPVKQAKIGSIIPIYKELGEEINALEYFAKLSNYGNKKNSILLEDKEKSIGSANPCLMVAGSGEDFEITALNNTGKRFLDFIKKDFKFCDKAIYGKGKIYGKLMPAKKAVNEDERLKSKTHLGIIRTVAFKFKSTSNFPQYCGLFGMVSDDFGKTVPDKESVLKDPDYIFYFLDNMFVVDHKAKKTYFIANALITDNNQEKTYNDCSRTINNYENLVSKKLPNGKKPKKKELKLSYDSGNDESLGIMKKLKKEIADGNILYALPSRTATTSYNAEPLDIYAGIKNGQASFVFYINDKHGVSIGAGTDAILNVKGESEKTVELKISASTMSRGKVKDEIEKDIDNRYEALLKVDENEIAYNMMLLDAARNDIARISLTGTRYVDKMLAVDKQTESQNLVSSVKGILNNDFDALHAYAAVFNPVTVDGLPKIKAADVLNKLEKEKKGFTSCSLLCITPDKNLQSISTKPIRIKKDKAYFKTSYRVFHNSNDGNEFKAGNSQAVKLLNALRLGGIK